MRGRDDSAGNAAQHSTFSISIVSMVIVILCVAVSGCAEYAYDWDCDTAAEQCVDKKSGKICRLENAGGNQQLYTFCDMQISGNKYNRVSTIGRSKYYYGTQGGAMAWRFNSLIDSVTVAPILRLFKTDDEIRPAFRWRGGGTSNDPVDGDEETVEPQ